MSSSADDARGASPSDIAKKTSGFLVVHEGMGLAWLATSWAACYHVQPSKALGSRFFRERSQRFFDVAERKLESYAKTLGRLGGVVNSIPGLRWLAGRIPGVSSADKARLAVSYAESIVVRNVARPVMIPLKIWLACQAVGVSPDYIHEWISEKRSGKP